MISVIKLNYSSKFLIKYIFNSVQNEVTLFFIDILKRKKKKERERHQTALYQHSLKAKESKPNDRAI